jgi:thiosulfate/3-mercaptopyruvate sulfurtransferase
MTDVLITAGELADLITKEPCVIIDTRTPMARGTFRAP